MMLHDIPRCHVCGRLMTPSDTFIESSASEWACLICSTHTHRAPRPLPRKDCTRCHGAGVEPADDGTVVEPVYQYLTRTT